MEKIVAFLNTHAVPIGALVNIGSIVKIIISALRALKNGKVKTPKPSKEKQFFDCDLSRCIDKRDSLSYQAKQYAKKRPKTAQVNVALLCFLALCLCAPSLLYTYWLPAQEFIDSSLFAGILYCIWTIISLFLFLFEYLLGLCNVLTWTDLIGKLEEHKFFKQSKREGYYVPISRVIDISSHFDTYFLFDADSRDIFLKDGVIGAQHVGDKSICDAIKNALNENGAAEPEQTQGDANASVSTNKNEAVVFIYSRHGKASYEQTKMVRESGYGDVYDLGPVCGYMRELENVAYKLASFQKVKCLRLP